MGKAARKGDSTKGSFTSNHCPHKVYDYDDDGHRYYVGKEHPGGSVSGTIDSGSPNVFINGCSAARKGDRVKETSVCTDGTGHISEGSSTVFVNGKPKARVPDTVDEHTDRDGKITTGSNNVYVGG